MFEENDIRIKSTLCLTLKYVSTLIIYDILLPFFNHKKTLRMYTGKIPAEKNIMKLWKKTRAHFSLTQIPSSGSPLLSSNNVFV